MPDAAAVVRCRRAASSCATRPRAGRCRRGRTAPGDRTSASTARSSGAPARSRANPCRDLRSGGRACASCRGARRGPGTCGSGARGSGRVPMRKTTKSPSISPRDGPAVPWPWRLPARGRIVPPQGTAATSAASTARDLGQRHRGGHRRVERLGRVDHRDGDGESHVSPTSRDRPRPSEPTTTTIGSVAISRSSSDVVPSASRPTTNSAGVLALLEGADEVGHLRDRHPGRSAGRGAPGGRR